MADGQPLRYLTKILKKVHQQFLVDAHTASLPSKTITLWIECKIGGQNYLFRCLKNRLYYQMVKMLFLFLRYWHHVTQTPVLIGFHLEMKLILHETSWKRIVRPILLKQGETLFHHVSEIPVHTMKQHETFQKHDPVSSCIWNVSWCFIGVHRALRQYSSFPGLMPRDST